jgi:hypothetical protein
MGRYHISLFLVITLVVSFAVPAACDEGGGRLRLGYIYTDEEGNLAVNQETFNLYDGFAASLENARFMFDNGVNLRADLRNVSLDNRNLNFSASKAKLFSVSFHHDQYRRIYGSSGAYSTDRKSTSGGVSISPIKNLTLFGGYNRTDKEGENLLVFEQVSDPVKLVSDYSYTSSNIGAQGFYKRRGARIEFRQFDFTDNTPMGLDREANSFRASAGTPVPKYERGILSAGYYYRLDKLSENGLELKTNQAWGAAKAYLPEQFTINYRFVFARTLHDENELETDNFLNTISVGKRWKRQGGVRVGYENRIADDLIDRSESHGFLFSGWYNYINRLFVKASCSTRDKEVVAGSTVLGDEDYTQHQILARYTGERWGRLSARVQSRVRENKDIGSRADYTSFSTGLQLDRDKYGRLSITYAYYLGQYENRSGEFELADHVVTGTITPVTYRKASASVGGTYYRSRRDLDVEKSNLHFGISYQLPEEFLLNATYRVYNHDDFDQIDAFYTGNVLEVSIAKDFSM